MNKMYVWSDVSHKMSWIFVLLRKKEKDSCKICKTTKSSCCLVSCLKMFKILAWDRTNLIGMQFLALRYVKNELKIHFRIIRSVV